jgi:hypothetical protein
MKETIGKAIWLHIVSEGGTWTPDEICEEFNMERKRTALMLHNMAQRDHLSHTKVKGRAHFGVKNDCVIPYGVTMAELLEALNPSPKPIDSATPTVSQGLYIAEGAPIQSAWVRVQQ